MVHRIHSIPRRGRSLSAAAWPTLAAVLALASPAVAQEAAGERSIPVTAGKGTLRKKAKADAIQAGGAKSGTFRRKKTPSLDPSYDPAQASEALGARGEEPGPVEPGGGRRAEPAPPAAVGDRAPDRSGGPGTPAGDNADKKKIEDLVSFKSNFEKDLKCRRLPLNAKVTLDFQEAPIESVIKLMSCWTDRNFLLATQKRGGKITILSPQPVTVYEAYRAFLSSMMVNGMAITKKGDFYHIVDTTDARGSGAEVYGPKGTVPDDDNIVTRIIRLKHLDAKDVEQLVGKFKSKNGDVFQYPPTNAIVITDSGSIIRRIQKLLLDFDVPMGAEKIWLRPVQHMDATELVEKVQAVFGEQGRGAPGQSAGPPGAKVTISKIIADDRSNQLILIATRANYLKVDALIRKLDVPIPGEGAVHIHHLENADAEDVAQTLGSLAQGAGAAQRGKKGGAKGAKSGSSSATLFEGDVKITAHKATNALVIEASLKDYLSLMKVIAQLDRRRKQVYVEAVIMEISTTKNRRTQLSGSAGTTFDIGGDTVPFLLGLGGLGIGGFDLNQLNSGGFAAGMQGPLVNVNTGTTANSAVPAGATLSIPAFGFMVQAIQENSDVNVLSTPHILTLNNEEAEITVGRKVPYRSQTSGGGLGGLGGLGALGSLGSSALSGLGGLGALGGALGGLGATVQHIDVDLNLKITPQINESDFIKLKIDEQLDEVEGIDPNLGPTTSKRKVSNTVVVRDQQPVVVGGLVTDRESSGVAKIPVLGDLPLIGMFFRKTVKTIEKKNLMLIVVPHIIKDPSDLERLHQQKMDQIRDFAEELATKQKEYQGKVDFRKKAGFLEKVFTSIDKIAAERKLSEKAYFDNADVDLVGPPDAHDLEYDPFASPRKDGKSKAKAGKPTEDDTDELDVESIDLPDNDPTPTAPKPGPGKAGAGKGSRP